MTPIMKSVICEYDEESEEWEIVEDDRTFDEILEARRASDAAAETASPPAAGDREPPTG